jgi:O-antigen/teichoic acid export membrane protein
MFWKKHYLSDVAWVTIGNVFRTGCVFVGWSFLARLLGNEGLGVFSFAFATMNLIASLSDFGLGVGIVKFIAAEPPQSKRANSILRVGFWVRAVVTLTLVSLLLIASKWLAITVMKNPVLHKPIIYASVGTIAATYFAYILSANQGLHRFKTYGLLSLLSGIILLTGLTILLIIKDISVEHALLVASFSFLLPSITGQFLMGWELTNFPSKECWQEARSIVSFSRWILVGSFIVLLIMQADTFILTRFSSLSEVGKYSASMRLALSISVLSNSMLTVVLPNILKKNDQLEIRQSFLILVKLIPKFSMISITLYGVAFFIAPWVVRYTFGPGYEESVLIFRILFGAFLLSILTNVINYFGYGINRPDIVTLNVLIQFIVLIVMGGTLVPYCGAKGMADAVLTSRVVGLIVISFFIYRLLGRKQFIPEINTVL